MSIKDTTVAVHVLPSSLGAVTNYCPKTSNTSISAPREKITQTNII